MECRVQALRHREEESAVRGTESAIKETFAHPNPHPSAPVEPAHQPPGLTALANVLAGAQNFSSPDPVPSKNFVLLVLLPPHLTPSVLELRSHGTSFLTVLQLRSRGTSHLRPVALLQTRYPHGSAYGVLPSLPATQTPAWTAVVLTNRRTSRESMMCG